MITFHDTLAGDVASLAEPEGGVLALVQPLPVPLVESLLVLDLEILRVELLHAEVAHKLVLHPGLGKQTALKIYLLHVISKEQRLYAILHSLFYLLSSLCEAMSMNPPPGGEAALQSGSDNIKTTKNFRRVVRLRRRSHNPHLPRFVNITCDSSTTMASLFAGGGVAFQFSFKQSALRNIYCVWRGVDSQGLCQIGLSSPLLKLVLDGCCRGHS